MEQIDASITQSTLSAIVKKYNETILYLNEYEALVEKSNKVIVWQSKILETALESMLELSREEETGLPVRKRLLSVLRRIGEYPKPI